MFHRFAIGNQQTNKQTNKRTYKPYKTHEVIPPPANALHVVVSYRLPVAAV